MKSVDSGGTKVAYEVAGEGLSLVLGHSFLMTRDMWRPQIEHLAASYRVVALDWRGHGESGRARGRVTMDDLVDDVLAVLDAEGIDRAVWGGLSIGGMVALRAAVRCPERVRALILVDTDADTWHRWEQLKFQGMGLVARLFGTRPLTPTILRMFFAKHTRAERPELVDSWREKLRSMEVRSLLTLLRTLAGRESLLARLGEISVPALVLHGADDSAINVERAQLLHRRIAGSQLKILEDCAHIASLDQPEIVTTAMEEFLALLAPSEG